MYAVLETGGKQYRVQEGDIVFVEKLNAEEGQEVNFETVLAVSTDKGLEVGTPYVKAASVSAKVLKQGRGEKIIVFKYKAKKNYKKKQGHRQAYTKIQIAKISV
ncbi:MAG: 50S ribosomal protein L21 [Deltaproteobacteria bacterium]